MELSRRQILNEKKSIPRGIVRILPCRFKYFIYRLEPVIPDAESNFDGTDVPEWLNTATSYIGLGGAGYDAYQAVVAPFK